MWHRITSFVLQSYAATATTLNLRKPSWRSNGKPEPHKLCLQGQRLKFSQEILFFPAACPFTRWHPVCALCWSMFCRGYINRICQKEGLPFNVPTDYHRIGGETRVVCCRRMQRATTCRRWKTEYGELHCKLYYLLHIEFELWLHTVQPPLDWPGPGVNTLVGVNNRLIESDSILWQLKSTC